MSVVCYGVGRWAVNLAGMFNGPHRIHTASTARGVVEVVVADLPARSCAGDVFAPGASSWWEVSHINATGRSAGFYEFKPVIVNC